MDRLYLKELKLSSCKFFNSFLFPPLHSSYHPLSLLPPSTSQSNRIGPAILPPLLKVYFIDLRIPIPKNIISFLFQNKSELRYLHEHSKNGLIFQVYILIEKLYPLLLSSFVLIQFMMSGSTPRIRIFFIVLSVYF